MLHTEDILARYLELQQVWARKSGGVSHRGSLVSELSGAEADVGVFQSILCLCYIGKMAKYYNGCCPGVSWPYTVLGLPCWDLWSLSECE